MPTCKAQRHNRLTFFSDESRHKGYHKRPTPRLNPPSTMGPSTRWTPDLYNGVRHHPQLNWGLSSNHNLLTTSSKQSIQQWWLGFPNGNPNHEILKQTRGEMKLLRWRCRSWPSPSILQRSTRLSGRKRRSRSFELVNNGGREEMDELASYETKLTLNSLL